MRIPVSQMAGAQVLAGHAHVELVGTVIVSEIHEPKLGDNRPLEIKLPAESCTPRVVGALKEVLAGHPGPTQVFLHLMKDLEKSTVLRLGSEIPWRLCTTCRG